jgi:hypothetical protein
MAIIVPIKTEWDKKQLDAAIKDINNAKGKLGGLSGDSSKASSSLGGLGTSFKKLGIVAAAAFGAKEIGQFFSSSIKGAIEDEKSLRVLNKTLANMGFKNAEGEVDAFIQKLQYSAGIADDQLRPALNNLVLATGNVTDSQKLLQLGLDVSAGSGRDLDSITVALAKAYNGNFTALKKMNLGIDETLIKNKDLDGIITVLTTKFAGASANAVDTYAGKLAILKLGVDDAKEAIGYGLLKGIESVTDALGLKAGGLASITADAGYEIGKFYEGVGIGITQLIEWKKTLDQTDSPFGKFVNRTIEAVGNVAALAVKLTFVAQLFSFFTDKVDEQSRAQAENNRWQAQANFWATQKKKTTEEAIIDAEAYAKAQEELKKQTQALNETNENYGKFVAGTSPQSIQGATALAQGGLVSIQKLMSSQPKINSGLVKSFKDLASIVQNNFSYALEQAKTKLAEAKQQYESFKGSIKGSITSIVNFGEQTEGLSFVANLEMQAEKAKNFGGQISKLLSMGLSQTALQQIADAGYDTGSVLAQQIIDGGSSVVSKVNQLVASVDVVGEQVSDAMADKFYGAGVNAAQNLVDGIINEINRSAQLIADALANLYKGQQTVNTGGKGKDPKKKDKKKKALGGNVFPNTSYLVGENGPEIFNPLTSGKIIPNNRMNSSGSSSINITVNAGMGTNGSLVGKQIVEAIKKYEKTSGQVFAGA